MSLSNIANDPNKRMILFGGKGGVGKTSISSATAIYLAEQGDKVLIISTDPAHSLSDAFSQDLSGGEVIQIEGVDGDLCGLEISPEKGTEEVKHMLEEEGVSDELNQSLSMLGLDDLTSDLHQNTPPGMDEAVALSQVMQIARQGDYDRIILDTAPTGHTIRLLSLPEFLDSFLGRLLKMRVKLSNTLAFFKSMVGMEAEKDRSVEIMEKLKENILQIREDLQNHTETEFVVVSIPTLMSVYESERLLVALTEQNILVRNVVINQIMPRNESCPFCSARYHSQQEVLEYARQVFSDYVQTELPYLAEEVKGVEKLRKLASMIFSDA